MKRLSLSITKLVCASMVLSISLIFIFPNVSYSSMPPVAGMGEMADTADTGMVEIYNFLRMVFGTNDLAPMAIPYGRIEFAESGDYALLPSPDGVIEFAYTGKAKVIFDGLPLESSLDLFHETGTVATGSPISLEIDGFYAKCGSASGMGEFGEGIPIYVDEEEPPDFALQLWENYVVSWSDAFPNQPSEEEMMAAMQGGGMPAPSRLVRDPNSDEFYLAFYTSDGKRFDYTADAEGKLYITDYRGGMNWYEHPYAVVEEDFDPRFDFKSKSLVYSYDPQTQGTSLNVMCTVVALENLPGYTVFCYPWLDVKYAEIDGVQVPFKRGMFQNEPTWAVDIQSEFVKGKEYVLYIEFTGEAPKSYDGIGYGGVYRFDDYALYTASDACDKSLYVEMPETSGEWKFIDSPGGTTTVNDPITHSTDWPDSSRGVMMVATQFPMKEFDSYGVKIEVYAPATLIDGVGQNPAVAQLGQILNYFSEQFGVFSAVYPSGKIERQPLFIIPNEGGVAAFENAGLLFYLGDDHNLPLVTHEVSHIWWGQAVDGPTWFVEGMANYCPIAYFEANEPAQAESYRRYIMQAAVASSKPMSLERRMELGDTSALYQHGAAMFVTMARIYGTQEFHSALKELNRKYGDGEALDADTIFNELWKRFKLKDQFLEDGGMGSSAGGGRDEEIGLQGFRAAFFDNSLAPMVSVNLVPKGQDGAIYNYDIVVSRDQRLKGAMPLDIYIVYKDGTKERNEVITNNDTEVYGFELEREATGVVADPDNKLLVNTPEREDYQAFLGWLTAAWMKRGMSDTEGAIYCFEQALKIRSWARDYNDLANLYFQTGRVSEARSMVEEMLDAAENSGGIFHDHEIEPKTLCQIHWLAGKIAEMDGKADEAKAHFEKVIELGNATGLYNLVDAAKKKLGIATEEAEGGAPASMGGMMGGM